MSAAPTIDIPTKADLLIAAYMRAGYARVSPAILQPAEPFLDLSGEDMRRHMYLVTDAAGRDLCLRPDLTISVARHYLASDAFARPANFCYLGPVFRDHGDAPGEFLQAGIECFGSRDTAGADAEVLALGLAATAHYGIAAPTIMMGDVGLFAALVEGLDLVPAWKRRLRKDFYRPAAQARYLGDDKASGTEPGAPERGARRGRDNDHGVLAAFADANPQAAQALVSDLLSIAGKTTVGGRNIAEIADRFVEQAELGFSGVLPSEIRGLIARFLAIAGTPFEAAAALRALEADAKISFGAALDLFERRNASLADRGIDPRQVRFATAFRRGVDYYTGFVFELHDPHNRAAGPLVAGGRYDGLLSRLGSRPPIPAVGFAVWIERLAACGGALPSGSGASGGER